MISAPVASDRLTPDQVQQVRDLVDRATDVDGVPPLSEHVVLHLAHGGDERSRHLVVLDGDRVVGYAHLDTSDEVEGPSAELVVDPERRGAGLGRLLAQAVSAEAGPRLRLWAHGEHPAAGRLARAEGMTRSRALWQMRRSLGDPLPPVTAPAGLAARAFRPGADDGAWVALNALAFAHHPEQGRWTLEDLRLRMAEPWFDPAGFFLAESEGRLVGFHWTKVHGDPSDLAAGGRRDHAHDHHHDNDHDHDHDHEQSHGDDHHHDGHHHDGHDSGEHQSRQHAQGGQDERGPGPAPGRSGHGHDPVGEVYVVGVDPAAQGRGIGPWLTLLGLQHLRDRGLPEAMLYVDEDNRAAVAVYERLGFRRTATDVSWSR